LKNLASTLTFAAIGVKVFASITLLQFPIATFFAQSCFSQIILVFDAPALASTILLFFRLTGDLILSFSATAPTLPYDRSPFAPDHHRLDIISLF
jgi:hypothetical protein